MSSSIQNCDPDLPSIRSSLAHGVFNWQASIEMGCRSMVLSLSEWSRWIQCKAKLWMKDLTTRSFDPISNAHCYSDPAMLSSKLSDLFGHPLPTLLFIIREKMNAVTSLRCIHWVWGLRKLRLIIMFLGSSMSLLLMSGFIMHLINIPPVWKIGGHVRQLEHMFL